MQDTSRFRVLGIQKHVLMNPGMYVGGTETVSGPAYLYDAKTKMIELHQDVPQNEGLLKIINEVIDNAVDNCLRDPPCDVIRVSVNLEDNTVLVSNNGKHIEVEKRAFNESITDWVPVVIFGEPMSGSNFNANREGTGMHGLGVKLTNIMSDMMEVRCFDPVAKRYLVQRWRDNMSVKDEVRVTPRTKAPAKGAITSVMFQPCSKLFGGQKIDENIFDQIRTRLFSISAIMKSRNVKMYLNDERINVNSFKAYVGMFGIGKFMYHEGECTTDSRVDFQYAVGMSKAGIYEHCSFVNNLETHDPASTHTRHVTNRVVGALSTYLSKKYGSNTEARLSRNFIESKLHVFVNLRMKNPIFPSQIKTTLKSPVAAMMKIDDDKVLRMAKSSGLLELLETSLSEKALSGVKSALNSKGKVRNLRVEKLDDAHAAGTANSDAAMLFLVEGDSAKTFVSIGMSVIGRKYYGVFPLRGKLLNVRGASPKQLRDNKEVCNLMQILGLNFNKKYATAEEHRTLRYGKMCILTDADVDGTGHISGLIINFFDKFWPALIRSSGFLFRFITPAILAKGPGNAKPIAFYTNRDYEQFVREKGETAMKRYHVQHLKGLGTSLRSDTVSYFKDMKATHLKMLCGSDEVSPLLANIFDPTRAAWRKEWLCQINIGEGDAGGIPTPTYDVHAKEVPIADFVETEMKSYSLYTFRRAIPSVIDGLKVCQRKILFGSFLKFGRNKNLPFKVAQLAAYVASESNYVHGEVALQQAIIRMAQNYPGSNNMNLLQPDGAFGSRLMSGQDTASPRYIHTRLTEDATQVFDAGDFPVLTNNIDENMVVEPQYYIPKLPMILINGAAGIATGYCTTVPCFNVEDVEKVICEIFSNPDQDDTQLSPLLPWYKGYSTNNLTTEDETNWYFSGSVSQRGSQYYITELPIGTAIDRYKDTVLTSLVESKVLKRFEVNHRDENSPEFILYPGDKWPADNDKLKKILKLTTQVSKNNMNLLDRNGHVVTFKTPVAIIRYWMKLRLECIGKRLTYDIEKLEQEMTHTRYKREFLAAIVQGRLDIRLSRASIEDYMHSTLGISSELRSQFLQLSLLSVSRERVDDLNHQLSTIEEQLNHLKSMTARQIFAQNFYMTAQKRRRIDR